MVVFVKKKMLTLILKITKIFSKVEMIPSTRLEFKKADLEKMFIKYCRGDCLHEYYFSSFAIPPIFFQFFYCVISALFDRAVQVMNQ